MFNDFYSAHMFDVDQDTAYAMEMRTLIEQYWRKIGTTPPHLIFEVEQERDKAVADLKKRHEEEKIRKLQLKALEKSTEHASNYLLSLSPSYDPIGAVLTVKGQEILIERGSKQADLCKIIFKDEQSKMKIWSKEEVFEEWYQIDEVGEQVLYTGKGKLKSKYRLQVYNAARGVTKKTAEKTNIDDLFVYDTHHVSLNQKYVD